jgi:hypothetical protein
MFAAREHEVFEKMGEPGLPRFFIFGTDMVPEVDGHDRRFAVLVDNQGQSVL